MPVLTDRLQAVREGVARLLRDHEALRQRNTGLETEARESKRLAEVLKVRVAELERDNEVLRKARPAGSGPGTTGTKERIDELVDEIDRCLALLNADKGQR